MQKCGCCIDTFKYFADNVDSPKLHMANSYDLQLTCEYTFLSIPGF
jgi:hypothetical protein